MPKPLPNIEVLLALFVYDPQSGMLKHKATGMEAFTTLDRGGYRRGKVGKEVYLAHRVAWKIAHGDDPDIIDHINGVPGDNRLSNLRSGSVADNSRNYPKPPGITSKYRGVCWVKRDRKWAARISNGAGGKFSLGNHDSEVDAALAYDEAARKYHGEFATLNFPLAVR